MSPRRPIGVSVFDAAIDRMVEVYEQGHRVVVSVSSGKDSTCAMEVCVIAAGITGRLPVEAVFRDEEILFPGSFEYAERLHEREDVDLHWLVANQPIVNCFNREMPYWWTFDPLLPEEEWVRTPPPYAEHITDINIEAMTTKARFPVDTDAGQELVSVVGLRVQESRGRMYGLFSAGGHRNKPDPRTKVVGVRPIYDWRDGDVWKAIQEQGWDYNEAYDVMFRLGVPRVKLRIGPPSMSADTVDLLTKVTCAWPQWWDRVTKRLPGIKSAAFYGRRVLQADRRFGETWEETFKRECIANAPEWIAERATRAMESMTHAHARHATTPFPETEACHTCQGNVGSWKGLTKALYLGDPFAQKVVSLPYVEPEFFRAGAGTWNGHPG